MNTPFGSLSQGGRLPSVCLDGVDRFPCNEDKRPALEGSWKTFAGRHDYSRWTLVGVPTGSANGFDVVDVDPKNGGDAWYKLNFDALPTTQAHESQSGGVHLLFRHAEGVLNSSSQIAKGVDVRGEGGYCIWWPREGLPFELHAVCEWPEWLLREARRPIRRKVTGSGGQGEGVPSTEEIEVNLSGGVGRPTRDWYARRKALLWMVANATPGKRSDRLFWAAERFAEMAIERHGRGKIFRQDRNAALQRAGEDLIQAATACGLIRDYGEGKVTDTIANGFRWVLNGRIDR